MKRGPLLLLPLLAACASGGPRFDDVREWRGATVRLRLVDVDPPLGRPLRVNLELHNGGSEPLTYDDQSVQLWGTEVVGPGDGPVRYIGWSAQTFGSAKVLDPGATAVLLESHDLSAKFLFERSGRYRIRFGGGGLSFPKPGEDWPGFHPVLLQSDWIEVAVGEGRRAAVVDVVLRLLPILPRGWEVATDVFEEGMTVRLLRKSERMGDEIWLQLGGAPDGFARLVDTRWGPLWLKNGDVIEPEFRPALLDALTRP